MSKDLSLEDLAGTAADKATDSSNDTAESGESLMELVQFMDERGYLQPLMFGLDNNETTEPATDNPANAPATDGDSVPLTAANIAKLSDRIQGQVGDVPISKIGQFAESNPEKVNALISQLE